MVKILKNLKRGRNNLKVKNKSQFNIEEFITKANLPAIPITIEGKEYIMLLDSGSDVSYLDTNILNNITSKILIGHQGEIVSANGTSESIFNVYNVSFTCGQKQFNEEFTSNDFTTIFNFLKEKTGIQLVGILGSKFMLKYKCILDFDKLIFYL